jgi:hypothetical protein
MLFHVSWELAEHTESAAKRVRHLLSKWEPGPAKFQGFYGFADGGGFAIIEAASAVELAKTLAPWTPFLKYTTRVILPAQESSEIATAAAAWRDKQ